MKGIIVLIKIISIIGDVYMLGRPSLFHGMNINSSQFASMQPFLLWETNGSSNQECAAKCLKQTSCLSFMRDEVSDACRIFSVNVNVTTGMTVASLKIYQRQLTCEDFGYISLQSTKKCIKLHYTETSWIKANETCASAGGKILSITTEEMYHDVVQTVSQTDAAFDVYFIDGNDNEVENYWVLSDGTPLSFLRLNDGEPTGGVTENCLLIASALYHDASCYALSAKFICEKVF